MSWSTSRDIRIFYCPDYSTGLKVCLREALNASRFSFQGRKVLVKPNLVAGKNGGIGCTEVAFIVEVCRILIDSGAFVTVGDSPAFGSAGKVARSIGLARRLDHIGVPISNLRDKKVLTIDEYRVGISTLALDSDVVVNLPKLKAHSQMRISAAVKNLFGCVPGLHKALWHARLGADIGAFSDLILGISRLFENVLTIVDGVMALGTSGPIYGELFRLGAVVSGDDPVAVDTSIYKLRELDTREVPLWKAAERKKIPQADPFALNINEESGPAWTDFPLPRELKSADFSPFFLLASLVRRLRRNIFSAF